jgi:hypothetical protein
VQPRRHRNPPALEPVDFALSRPTACPTGRSACSLPTCRYLHRTRTRRQSILVTSLGSLLHAADGCASGDARQVATSFWSDRFIERAKPRSRARSAAKTAAQRDTKRPRRRPAGRHPHRPRPPRRRTYARYSRGKHGDKYRRFRASRPRLRIQTTNAQGTGLHRHCGKSRGQRAHGPATSRPATRSAALRNPGPRRLRLLCHKRRLLTLLS